MDKLVDASLSPDLASRPFKFTSKQGRNRRAQLLSIAFELLKEKNPEEISFADICKKAKIPRPSAYHFFPNVEAIFHGIRLLHSEGMVEKLTALKEESFQTWKEYIERSIEVAIEVTNSEIAFPRLIYGYRMSNPEMRLVGQELDLKLANLTKQGLVEKFDIPSINTLDQVFGVAISIPDSLLKLSYRTFGDFTPWMIGEAKKATISYLLNYLPEVCEPRK
ncbi:TetR/AcrR family transcriptional regulator [Leptospira biflexa]|jgi:AcrR family transcriptional regulator|uniref:Putative regulator protein, TetR family n=1 Tax=Leptospira biflexa serovar Patoc (strain Patoc 1 / ATCC 23582 / Paris) TaxID=456481 RepID=B0SLI5_LEPBP|nr:TetR family transcriptional regulator [Leptospira biflexa]ABZ94899.1 Transcriptional regulator, AcrR-family [Leptospira biflexa serovar Patoc strain 'Patoc 1 (Ames)']ABZ98571.1 Putative regulator protein, TetR family [Leptospira biflexa serovar Patoc strain 'Patoc 1 (Paris)']TGM33657.1 TetR/AcrR family transcriptional regulator [Leptospira biflexa]TGM34483.1 TetR/AcrR family transcriptional regulator [Leptospira biflexa]TGM43951.1 TetR/AcrR family transcriptional regulator [Leptospira bifle